MMMLKKSRSVLSLGVCLAALLLAWPGSVLADDDSDAKGPNPRTILGTWTAEIVPDDPAATGFRTFNSFLPGGAWIGTSPALLMDTSHGAWKRLGKHRYALAIYIPVAPTFPNPPPFTIDYHLKLVQEIKVVGKNRFEGRSEMWYLAGDDPLNPIVQFVIATDSLIGTRIPAEAP